MSISGSGSSKTLSISGGNSVTFNVSDADSSKTNELQTLSKSGSTVTLSQSGGSFNDDDKQTLSISGSASSKTLSISGGNSITFNTADGDSSASNELQNLAITGTGSSKRISISNGNNVTLNVSDADSSASNELQSLSVRNDSLFISSGNGVKLPSGSSSTTIPVGVRIGFSASTTWTCPAGVTQIILELWGGGGGGSGSSYVSSSCYKLRSYNGCTAGNTYSGLPGATGGSGGYIKQVVTVVPGNSYSIVIGSGGTGGSGGIASSTSGNAGTAGNSSSFGGSITAPGGGGGAQSSMTCGCPGNTITAKFGCSTDYDCANLPYPSVGSAGNVTNYNWPNTPSTPAYIPNTYLTGFPSCCASGGSGGVAAGTAGSGANGLSGGAGANGFCVISY